MKCVDCIHHEICKYYAIKCGEAAGETADEIELLVKNSCADRCSFFNKKKDFRYVIQCKDCMFSRKVDEREPMYKCGNICRDGCTQWVGSDDFCSYGEMNEVSE